MGDTRGGGAGGAVSFNPPDSGKTTFSKPDASGGSKRANRAIGGAERPKQAKAARKLTRRK